MSAKAKIWIIAAAGLVVAQALASLFWPRDFRLIVFSDVAQGVLLLSGTLALLGNVISNRGRTRLFWALMTLGLAFWFVYQVLWTYFEVILHQDVPNPWVGDIVLVLHIVPMMGAIALQPHMEQDDRMARLGALDFALLLVWWLYLYLFAVIPWQYAHVNELAYSHNLNALYLTEKIVLLTGLAIVWTRSTGSWKSIYGHWIGASLTYGLSSYVANWAISAKVYYTGSFYDVPLVISMGWVTAIGLMGQGARAKQLPVKASPAYGVWVARFGMIAVFSLPLFAIWSMYDQAAPAPVRQFRMLVSLGALLVMGGMAFIKQHLLDRELVDLLRASRESYDDLKRLQNQLVHSEKLASMGHLVGGAAHELNNPLTAMLGYSDLLSATPMGEAEKTISDKIGQQVRRTKSLVSSLLNFAQQTRVEKIKIDLNVLAQTAIKLSQPQLYARKVEVQTDLASDLPPVWGDSNQLLQVCLHIANNALLAMAEHDGMLTVRSCRAGDFAVLEFSDNSLGQPQPAADAPNSTLPASQNTGLGLSACYGIIQEHKGRILCGNRPQGGRTFRIELPAVGTGMAGFVSQEASGPAFALPGVPNSSSKVG